MPFLIPSYFEICDQQLQLALAINPWTNYWWSMHKLLWEQPIFSNIVKDGNPYSFIKIDVVSKVLVHDEQGLVKSGGQSSASMVGVKVPIFNS